MDDLPRPLPPPGPLFIKPLLSGLAANFLLFLFGKRPRLSPNPPGIQGMTVRPLKRD